MTIKEKLDKLTDLFELDDNALTPDLDLETLDQWDSMSKLSLIVLMDDDFGKKLTGEKIKSFKTIQDILDFMD